jgi:hypothetical protein
MNAHRPRRPLSALRDFLVRPLVRLGGKRRSRSARLWLEPLEDRSLLSVSISGTIFNNLNQSAVPGAIVFLDANGNGQLDQHSSTTLSGTGIAASATQTATPLLYTAPLQVGGIPANFDNVTVTLNGFTAGTTAVEVALVSPKGFAAVGGPFGPNLVTVTNGSFSGTLDDNVFAGAPTVNGTTVANGTFRPLQSFKDPGQEIYDVAGNADGGWRLVFFGPTGANISNFSLAGWSLTFDSPELSTTTDATGAYAFNDLPQGTYHVTVVNDATGTNPALTVDATAPGAVTGQDLTIAPNPNLVGTQFQVASASAPAWGSTVAVTFTVTNKGAGVAPASVAQIDLSSDAIIDGQDSPLLTVSVPSLQPGESNTQTVSVQLPGSAPAGFQNLDTAYLGLRLDPDNLVHETSKADNANQGAGLDLAAVAPPVNVAITSDTGVQQNPSVAVDPTNASHLVIAYMDYSSNTTHRSGYAGIGISTSTDGGATWTRSSIPLPTGFDDAAGYPVAKFDAQGHLFVSFMAVKYVNATTAAQLPPVIFPASITNTGPLRALAMKANNGIFVATLSGGTWTTTAVASQTYNTSTGPDVAFDALPDMAIDAAGKLYVTWTRFYPGNTTNGFPQSNGTRLATGGSDIMLAVSSDSGQHWTQRNQGATLVPILREPSTPTSGIGSGSQFFSQVAVGTGGNVYVSYVFTSNAAFRVRHSADGGQTFDPIVTAAANNPFNATADSNSIPGVSGTAGGPFRAVPVRGIAVDPNNPQTVYATDALQINKANTTSNADPADINFAVSDNSAQTWERAFSTNGTFGNIDSLSQADLTRYRSAVNDDNGNNFLRSTSAADLNKQEISMQAQPRMVVDSQGDIIIIWYDSRRDPFRQKFDVYAAVSTDGGRSFGPNIRLTTTSFDPSKGRFADPTTNGAATDNFFGDYIGLAVSNGIAYAAWTDTRSGTSQDIYFTRFAINARPQSAGDPYEPNDTPATATELGSVGVPETLGGAVAGPGDVDHFHITTGATGELIVKTFSSQPLTLRLLDSTGNVVVANGADIRDANGNLLNQEVDLQVVAGQQFYFQVSGVPVGGTAVPYLMALQDITADLGANVTGSTTQTLATGGTQVFALTAPVAGSFTFTLTANAGFTGAVSMSVISADGSTTLSSGTGPVTVTQGQQIFIKITGNPASTSHGSYTLSFNNRDQYQTTGQKNVFFPTSGGDPVSVAAGAVNGDNHPDLVTVNTDLEGPVSVLLNDGSGLFGAPQTYDGGTGSSTLPGGGQRTVVLDNFTSAAGADVAFTNFPSSDVSVLSNTGGGTFGGDRRSDASAFSAGLASADFDGKNGRDLIDFPSASPTGEAPVVSILLNHGDGTFLPPETITTGLASGTVYGVVGDFNGDHKDDFAVFSANSLAFEVYLGNGDGTFQAPIVSNATEGIRAVAAGDLNGDGKTDLVLGGGTTGQIYVFLSDGSGHFNSSTSFATFPGGPSSKVIGLAIADGGTFSGSTSVPGLPDHRNDIYAITAPNVGGGLPRLTFLAQNASGGFATALLLGTSSFNGGIATADFDGDGRTDVAVTEAGGVRVFYNQALTITPPTTPGAARDLGEVEHVITAKQVISPSFTDAYFKFTVPVETSIPLALRKQQVVDFSALFSSTIAPGLQMEILSADGSQVFGTGPRLRLAFDQGTQLLIHIKALAAGPLTGAGAYTLDIDVLPQVVSVAANSLLVDNSGQSVGPATTLVLTLQGDRLNAAAATVASNYIVTLTGNGPLEGVPPIQSVTYNPGADAQVSQGRTLPDDVLQTITLVFSGPLPVGSYQIEFLPGLQTANFNASENSALASVGTIGLHPMVRLANNQIDVSPIVPAPHLVTLPGQVGDLNVFNTQGTSFLTNFHDDMGAVLNGQLTQTGDSSSVTQALLNQIVARFQAVAGPAGTPSLNFLVIVLDPVSIDLEAPDHTATTYNLQTAVTTNAISRTFLEVGGNVEVMVLASVAGTYNMNISNVPASARGAAAVFADGQVQTAALTDAIRGGQTQFQFVIPEAAVAAGNPGGGNGGGGTNTAGGGSGGTTSSTVSTGPDFNGGLPGAGTAGAQVAANLAGVVFEFSSSGGLLNTMFGGSGLDAPPSAGGDPNAVNDNDGQDGDPQQQQQRREDATRRFGLGTTAALSGPATDGDPVHHDNAGVSDIVGAGLGVGSTANPGPHAPAAPPVVQPLSAPAAGPAVDEVWDEVSAEVPPALPEAVAAARVATDAAFAEPTSPAGETGKAGQLSPLVAAAVFTSGLYQQWWGKGDGRERKAARTPSRRPVKELLLS